MTSALAFSANYLDYNDKKVIVPVPVSLSFSEIAFTKLLMITLRSKLRENVSQRKRGNLKNKNYVKKNDT